MAERASSAGWRRGLARIRQRVTLEHLGITTVILGYVLILIGGVVRIEGAGMGCGDDWPICNGKVIPTFTYLTAIEYLHRVVAGLILLLTTALTIVAWRTVPPHDIRRGLSVSALALVLLQAGLGAVTVFAELDPRAVTAHLGMAQAYFAVVIVIALFGSKRLRRDTARGSAAIGRAAAAACATTFILLLTGAYTASSGAAWACPSWPLCGDKYVPTGWSLVDIHVLHRWMVLFALVAIIWLVLASVRNVGASAPLTLFALAALGFVLIETLIGAANIWLELADWVRISHLAAATLVWGCLVTAAVLNARAMARSTA
ncbi:MAG: COX15/CtaA family protein [Thermomicrobiales bacterium]|nr:COX15/CtaA family protein [Thermomicrobiales bacterium]